MLFYENLPVDRGMKIRICRRIELGMDPIPVIHDLQTGCLHKLLAVTELRVNFQVGQDQLQDLRIQIDQMGVFFCEKCPNR